MCVHATTTACKCRGKYDGPEPARLAVLKYAAHLGASHVDVELKAAPYFFAGACLTHACCNSTCVLLSCITLLYLTIFSQLHDTLSLHCN